MALTMDNAKNNDKFFEESQSYFPHIRKLSTRQIRCFAHIVNLSCQDYIKESKKLEKKTRKDLYTSLEKWSRS